MLSIKKPINESRTKRINKYTNYLAIGLLAYSFIGLLPAKTLADGTSLKISPSSIRLQAQAPADIHAPFTIENQSDNAISFKIGYKLFDTQNSQNGTVIFLKDGQSVPGQDQHFFDKVQVIDSDNFSHDIVELGPKQKKQLMLRISLPAGEPSADYYFSLVFLENTTQLDQTNTTADKKKQPSAITLQSGIGNNVFLAVGPKVAPQAKIDTFTTSGLKLSGPIPFLLQVSNKGSHYLTSSGTITIKNLFGQAVGKVSVPKSVILAGTSRTFTSTSNQSTANDAQLLSGSTVIWPQKLLLGFYTATLDLSLTDQGPVVARTTRFMVLPLSFLLGLLLSVVGIGLIFWRVRKKLREQ